MDRKPSQGQSYAVIQKKVEEAWLRGFGARQRGEDRYGGLRKHDVALHDDGLFSCSCGQNPVLGGEVCPKADELTERDPVAWAEGWDTADGTAGLKGEDYLRSVKPVPPPQEHPRKLKYADHPSLLEADA